MLSEGHITSGRRCWSPLVNVIPSAPRVNSRGETGRHAVLGEVRDPDGYRIELIDRSGK